MSTTNLIQVTDQTFDEADRENERRAHEAADRNERRVDCAEAALAAHARRRDSAEVVLWNLKQTQDQVTDLLTDLRHFCDHVGLPFNLSLSISQSHHRAEAKEAQA